MTKEELADLVGVKWAQPDTEEHHHLLAILQVRCVSDIEKALKALELSQEKSSTIANILSGRLFWLNVILTAATIAYSVVTVLAYFRT